MSSPKSLFGKAVSKKPRLDDEDKCEDTTSRNTGRNILSSSVRKPAFNPALLSSAFYTGPTMYGGAGACSSSSPVNQYAKSKFYDRKKTDIKVTPSTPETSMSQTSRRIMDLLEQYSSPISDIKRVPINNRPTYNTQRKTLNTSSIFDISKKSVYEDSLTPNTSKAHRFRELQIPSMATLMKIKKTNRSAGNAQAAIIASLSSSLPYKPETYSLRSIQDNNTYKNKIKTKVTSSRANKVDADEMALPVNLPNISLNMTGLPTFTMEAFKPPATSTSSNTKPYTPTTVASNFKFTSPVAVAKGETSHASKKFHFSEPLDIFSPEYVPSTLEDNDSSPKGDSLFRIVADSKSINPYSNILSKRNTADYNVPLINFKSGDSETTPKSNKRPIEEWNGNDKWKNKDSEKTPLLNGDLKTSNIFGKNLHGQNESGKVKDPSFDEVLNPNVKKIKADFDLPPSGLSGLESFIKKQQEQWECSSCMTRNEQDKNKCACCEAAKPGAAPAPATAPAPSGLASFIQKQQEQWECSSCMTRNDQSKVKCVCCETAKPGSAPSKPISSPPYSGMASFIQKQQSQWECLCCMTRNDQNRAKCVCCEASKPGAEPTSSTGAKFNFGTTQNTFKFGIDKANDMPVTDDKSAGVSKKPEAPTASGGFVFGNTSTLPATEPPTAPVGGFKFGVTTNGPTTNSTPPISKPNVMFGSKKEETTPIVPVGAFTFGIKKPEETKVSETPTAQTEIKTNLFSFSSPKLTNETKTEISKPNVSFTAQSDIKAASPPSYTKPQEASSAPRAVTTSSVSTASTPAFTFGAPAPAKPMFGNSTPFQFGAVTSNPIGTPANTTDNNIKAGLFTFGSKPPSSAETKVPTELNATPKPVFQLQSATSGSLFPSTTPQMVNNNVKSPLPGITGAIQFNATDKPKDQPTAPFFGFTSPSSNNSITGSTFKSPTANLPAFSFGSAPTTKVETSASLFNTPATVNSSSGGIFGAKAPESALNPPANSMFKPSASTTTSSFPPPSANIFGSAQSVNSQPPTSNLFGSGALNSTAGKPPVAIFGSPALPTDPSAQPPQASSLFSNPTMPTPSFNAGSIFGNTAQSGSVPSQPGNLFGGPVNKPSDSSGGMFMNNPQPAAPSNMFGSAMVGAAPAQSSSGMFGSSPAVPTPVFGASIPFGEASQSQAPQNVSFKFGASNSSVPPGVGFGAAAGGSGAVFSFGSGAPAPQPTNSQFNFSMGAPSSSFPNTPGAVSSPNVRRIKKAVRRNVLR